MMSRFSKVGALAAWFFAAAGAMAQDPRMPAPKDGSSYWLPPRFSEAYVPLEIDGLWNNIMVVVTITSIVVYGIFLWCMVAYRKKEGQKALFTHGNHTLEIVWTIVPAGILVWLAFGADARLATDEGAAGIPERQEPSAPRDLRAAVRVELPLAGQRPQVRGLPLREGPRRRRRSG
jgi:heme/copper-type cytochrome/quinol oxidase subunit 2